jgi:serine/threonine protein kinase
MTTGMQFGRYTLRERLGTGGMASVWKAVDEAGRKLVVKRILPSLAADAEFVAMFDREARLSARMDHRNIVRVLDHGDYEGERYLAMEQLDGRDLSTVMMRAVERGGSPSPALGAYVAREACRALAYVHALRGDDNKALHLVHRDVSLSNVMLGFDGSVKLLDFGVAKALADQLTQRTQAGVLKGKWSYLAPEQIEGGDVDQRTDLFALGIVMWEMLTGKRLFKAATGLETLEKVRAARVLPPSTLNPAVPPALDAIVLKALAKAPCDRWRSAAQLAGALEKVVTTLGFGGRELASTMMTLFPDDAPLWGDEDTLPMPRSDEDWLREDDDAAKEEPRQKKDLHQEVTGRLVAPRPLVSSVPPLRLPPLLPHRARSRFWRLLIAAALAALLGGFTGWQISLLHAAR